MIDWRLFLCAVSEVGFLAEMSVRIHDENWRQRSLRKLTYLSIPVVSPYVIGLLTELESHNLMHDGLFFLCVKKS